MRNEAVAPKDTCFPLRAGETPWQSHAHFPSKAAFVWARTIMTENALRFSQDVDRLEERFAGVLTEAPELRIVLSSLQPLT